MYYTKRRLQLQQQQRRTTGGKVIGSGGFGCVFRPALKCKGKERTTKKMVSKLMVSKYAESEYDEIVEFKSLLKSIPNYEKHFLLNDITICQPDTLSPSDLRYFNNKCHALEDEYSAETINSNAKTKLKVLTIPDGGEDLKHYMDSIGYKELPAVNDKLIYLLVGGIVEMNKKHVLHADLKDSNIMMNTERATIIDWGLSTSYTTAQIPDRLKNRSIYYNLPFSGIIFNTLFDEMYLQFLHTADKIQTHQTTRVFVGQYVEAWFNYRGEGHYSLIKRLVGCLFVDSLISIDTEEVAMNLIVDYIVAILMKYTKKHKFNKHKYFMDVYRHIIDIWGFMTVYLSVLEILSHKYTQLNDYELDLFKSLKHVILKYTYEPRVVAPKIKELVADLKDLTPHFIKCSHHTSHIDFSQSSKTSFSSEQYEESEKHPLTKQQTRKLVQKMISKTRKSNAHLR